MEIAAPCTHLSKARSPKLAWTHLIKYLTWLFPWDQHLEQAAGSLGMGLRLGGEKSPMPLFPSLSCSASPGHLQSPSCPRTREGICIPEGRNGAVTFPVRAPSEHAGSQILLASSGRRKDFHTWIKPSSLLPLLIRSPTQPAVEPRGHRQVPEAGEGSGATSCPQPGVPLPCSLPCQPLCLGHLLCSELRG